MAANTTSSLSAQYQKAFSKELLKYAVQALVLAQFGQRAPLPTGSGAKVIRWFRYDAPSSGLGADGITPSSTGIQSLSEGVTPATSTYRTLSLSTVDGTLAQYGQVVQITDILKATEFFDSLAQATKINGQDAALHADSLIRNELGANGTTKRYGSSVADFATLIGTATASAKITATNVLDCTTNLKINRAPMINGNYVGVIPPQISRDLMRDADWLTASQYSNVQALYQGEIGKFYGVRFVEATNPWIEDETEGTYDAVLAGGSNTTGLIYSTFFLGEGAFGVPDLASQSPFGPQVIITAGADKSDPLNQTTNVGFKTFWCAKILNAAYFVNLRCKSNYV